MTTNSSPVYAASLNVVSDSGLDEHVSEPTRTPNGNANVYLLFSNKRDYISKKTVIPGISDHKAVVANLKCSCEVRYSVRPRNIFEFDWGDYTSFSSDLFEFLPEVLFESDTRAVNDLRDIFKSNILF